MILFFLLIFSTSILSDTLTLDKYYLLTDEGTSKNTFYGNLYRLNDNYPDLEILKDTTILKNIYYTTPFRQKMINGLGVESRI